MASPAGMAKSVTKQAGKCDSLLRQGTWEGAFNFAWLASATIGLTLRRGLLPGPAQYAGVGVLCFRTFRQKLLSLQFQMVGISPARFVLGHPAGRKVAMRMIALALSSLAAVGFWTGAATAQGPVPRPAAVVNGMAITMAEVETLMKQAPPTRAP